VYSPDGTYRYWLERTWDRTVPRFTYVLLNPSRAGAFEDDPTTRKLQNITAANGGGGYVLVNLFASVDTHQTGLHLAGAAGESAEENDHWVRAAVEGSPRIVVGWGAGNGDADHHGDRKRAIVRRADDVWPVLERHDLWCVAHNRCGSPRHPGRGVRNDVLLRRYLPLGRNP
jgi:hypothetical protein